MINVNDYELVAPKDLELVAPDVTMEYKAVGLGGRLAKHVLFRYGDTELLILPYTSNALGLYIRKEHAKEAEEDNAETPIP